MHRVCCLHRDLLLFSRSLHGELSLLHGSSSSSRMKKYGNALFFPLTPGFIRRHSLKLEAKFNVEETEFPHHERQRQSLERLEQRKQHKQEDEVEDESTVAHGSIHLIIGPMFAGKTTALLKRVQAEANDGRRVAMVKSSKDTRYASTAIVSHDNMQMPCWAVPTLANFRSQIGEAAYSKLDVIGIDEAQFLTDLCSFCQTAADYEGKTLIIAGLDGDFLRNRFGSVLDLIPIADSVIKLSAFCELCGKPACFTFRKSDERRKELIGGSDTYMPVCRRHYFSGKIAMETAQTVLDAHKLSTI